MTELAYPPSPKDVPSGFTAPDLKYRLQVVVVLLGLLAFLLLYGGAIASLVWLLVELWSLGLRGRGGFWLALGGSAILVLLLAFLVKGIFKTQRMERDALIEITKKDEPKLFSFLARLCAETGAPFPKRVYITHDVNAAVFYDTSFLSLFLPVRKNLLIGLGLVNALTVSELKAVIGHELGHFSQSAMKVGTYVYVANKIIADMIWGRDAWDDFLAGMRRTDIRIAALAWIVYGLVWVLRQTLGLAFKGLNLLHLSLSRQMEFHADRVAVSVAGSDALTEGLYRAAFADACFAETLAVLTHASDHGMHTRDLFVHQSAAEGWLRKLHKKPQWGARPPRDGETHWVFEDDPIGKPSMWASHPPSFEREKAAKAVMVRAKLDDRPAWELFQAPAALRERVTRHFLAKAFAGAKVTLHDPAEIQRFIDEERAETAFDERYHEMYDGRPLAADLDVKAAFAAATASAPRDAILARYAKLWDDEVAALGKRHGQLREEMALLFRAARGELKGSSFAFRGSERQRREAERLIADVTNEMKVVDGRLDRKDHEVLAVHAEMATALGAETRKELRRRYRFQHVVASIQKKVLDARQAIEPVLQMLGSGKELSESEVMWLFESLEELHVRLDRQLERARKVEVPALRNFEEGANLGEFLLPRALPDLAPVQSRSVQGWWIQAILADYAEVLDKLGRLHAKGMGALLACQVEIHERYVAMPAEAVAPVTDDGDDAFS